MVGSVAAPRYNRLNIDRLEKVTKPPFEPQLGLWRQIQLEEITCAVKVRIVLILACWTAFYALENIKPAKKGLTIYRNLN
jgi:hypothetical protein